MPVPTGFAPCCSSCAYLRQFLCGVCNFIPGKSGQLLGIQGGRLLWSVLQNKGQNDFILIWGWPSSSLTPSPHNYLSEGCVLQPQPGFGKCDLSQGHRLLDTSNIVGYNRTFLDFWWNLGMVFSIFLQTWGNHQCVNKQGAGGRASASDKIKNKTRAEHVPETIL